MIGECGLREGGVIASAFEGKLSGESEGKYVCMYVCITHPLTIL